MHIAPDWLLIYHIENETVYLDRTGSHAELLKR
jgi:mRNA interferase YafQ